MNNSMSSSNEGPVFSNDYLTITIAVLFIISEAMPFINRNRGNGLCDSVVCLLRGSKCMIDKALEVVEQVETKDIEIQVNSQDLKK